MTNLHRLNGIHLHFILSILTNVTVQWQTFWLIEQFTLQLTLEVHDVGAPDGLVHSPSDCGPCSLWRWVW